MDVILQTGCGCSRRASVPDNAHDFIVPVLNRSPKWAHDCDADGVSTDGVLCRRFVDSGRREQIGSEVLRVFVETGLVRAHPPQVISLAPNPADEWKDAVCRVYDWVDRSAGLAVMDAEFVEKHAAQGGTIVQTQGGGGRLVGAYYYGPSWQHAVETVATFRRLDVLRSTGLSL